jgi:hypothetical protein
VVDLNFLPLLRHPLCMNFKSTTLARDVGSF